MSTNLRLLDASGSAAAHAGCGVGAPEPGHAWEFGAIVEHIGATRNGMAGADGAVARVVRSMAHAALWLGFLAALK